MAISSLWPVVARRDAQGCFVDAGLAAHVAAPVFTPGSSNRHAQSGLRDART
jgi:hypothetical protein